jgi:hypothetical protein
MAPLPKLMSQAELYPPASPGAEKIAADLLTEEMDWSSGGKRVLARAPTPAERRTMHDYLAATDPWAKAGERKAKGSAVTAMLMGFGGVSGLEDAMSIAKQYVAVVDDIPAWAVARACMRFSAGEVTAADLGEESFNRSFRPSTAHVHIISARIAEEFFRQRHRAREVLEGVTKQAPELTAEERTRISAKFDELLGGMKSNLLEQDDAGEAERRRRQAWERRSADDEARILQEYRQAGLDPPEKKPGCNMPCLALLLTMGWTIEEVGGKKALVSPNRPAKAEQAEPAREQEVPF